MWFDRRKRDDRTTVISTEVYRTGEEETADGRNKSKYINRPHAVGQISC